MKWMLILVCIGVSFYIGMDRGKKQAREDYEKKLSEYSIVFTPSMTKLVSNVNVSKMKWEK